MAHPPYTPAEQRAREAFLALMWALSYPGRVYTLPAAAPPMHLIAEALLDLETSFYTPDAALADHLARTGARSQPPERAAYQFYPVLRALDLDAAAQASTGTLLYPDRAATLIIGCALERGDRFTLKGPGINGTIHMQIGGLPPGFWALRAQHSFPLGWDVILLDDRALIGLPRSTQLIGGE